jgi:hypothetical protein
MTNLISFPSTSAFTISYRQILPARKLLSAFELSLAQYSIMHSLEQGRSLRQDDSAAGRLLDRHLLYRRSDRFLRLTVAGQAVLDALAVTDTRLPISIVNTRATPAAS